MKKIMSWKSLSAKQEYLDKLAKNTKKEAVIYNRLQNYNVGDYINHSKFGIGFILKIISSTKMEVFFKDSEKVMLQNWK